jgi:hypothetical protein
MTATPYCIDVGSNRGLPCEYQLGQQLEYPSQNISQFHVDL